LSPSKAAEKGQGVPSGWAWSAVADVGEVSLGRQRSPANHSGPDMRPYVRSANITWAGLDLSDVKEMNFDAADFARFHLEDGDVLLNEGSGSASEVGKPAIWRGEIADCCFQNTLLRVKPRGTSPEYLRHYFAFSARSGRFIAETQGVNIFHIGKDGLAKFPLPVPPLAEQRRIVAKLDALTARTARARTDLDRIPALAARYKQALLAAAFRGDLMPIPTTIEAVRIEEVAAQIFDGPFGSNLKSDDYVTSGVRVVRLENIAHLSFVEDKQTFISEQKFESLSRHSLQAEDVLFSSFVAEQVRVCVLPTLDTSAINKADCFCIRLDRQRCDPRFLALRLACESTFKHFEGQVHGATRPRINLRQLKAFEFDLPPLEWQVEIVRRIDQAFAEIDRLTAEAAAARRLLDRLDQAVLAKAFRGELVPQDPADEPASVLLDRIRAERPDARVVPAEVKA
jgi:type I restriction enzyme S subunit